MGDFRRILTLAVVLSPALAAGPGHAASAITDQAWDRASTCMTAAAGGPVGGARCVGSRMGGLFLDEAVRFMTEQGRGTFGDNFSIAHRMAWSPFGGGLAGELDMVVPLASSGADDPEKLSGSAFFLQHGVTRWTDEHGLRRNDLRLGTAFRFTLPSFAGADVFGVSTLVQENVERGHQRLVVGADYAGGWGVAAVHHYVPTTDWRRGRPGREERAIGGTELSLRFDLTTTLSLDTALGRWERDAGLRSRVDGRLGLDWQPHPYFRLDAGTGFGPDAKSGSFLLSLNVPFGGSRKPPKWEGLGAFGLAAAASGSDLWRPVENVGRIQTIERTVEASSAGTDDISVQFLQSSAASGDVVELEVSLSAAASEDVRLSVRLVPGAGDNPAVAGVDYVDETKTVTIRKGATSVQVSFQLLDNPDLASSRTLSVEVVRA